MKKFLFLIAAVGLLFSPILFGAVNAKADEFAQAPQNEQIQKQSIQHFQQLAQDDDQNSTSSDD
jgi:hypothetical protein